MRDAILIDEFMLDLAVRIPDVRLVRSQVGKHKLRTFLRIVLLVITCNHGSTVAGLIVDMVIIFLWVNQAHVKAHFTGIIRGNEHLSPFLRCRKEVDAPKRWHPRFGKVHKFLV